MSGLKIGDSAEVIEILDSGNYFSIYKIGDWGIEASRSNEVGIYAAHIGIQGGPWYVGDTVKFRVVGRLRITKVK